ncbi:MAG TPA: hydroxymethylbilane synthase [Hyphomicrobiaceae bacterium]|nr:hydroxymethylbilane synthase [Hyphomicrobiaceae bacterium]
MQAGKIRIGTRGSPLALAQAHEVRQRLQIAHGLANSDLEIRTIRTSGDRIQDRPLSEVGGKGLFTKEIEEGLLSGGIDLAVHSTKDMQTVLPSGLTISAVLPREDVRDAFISIKYVSLADLPPAATVGTSSLRRQAQVRRLRPDLQTIEFRGNVETRLKKLQDGAVDATLLAAAGLNRLGKADRITAYLPVEDMLPAVGQGAIAVEVRSDDAATRMLLAPLNDEATALCIAAERAFLAQLDGSCRTPIAGLAELRGGLLHFRGMILSPDGVRCLEVSRTGTLAAAVKIGVDAGSELVARAGRGFFGGAV